LKIDVDDADEDEEEEVCNIKELLSKRLHVNISTEYRRQIVASARRTRRKIGVSEANFTSQINLVPVMYFYISMLSTLVIAANSYIAILLNTTRLPPEYILRKMAQTWKY
jgi:hypothetical protein